MILQVLTSKICTLNLTFYLAGVGGRIFGHFQKDSCPAWGSWAFITIWGDNVWITKLSKVFLQRLANHPNLKNDRNLHVFLEYEQVGEKNSYWSWVTKVQKPYTLARTWMWGVKTRRRSWQGSSTPFKKQVSVTIQPRLGIMFLWTRRWAVTLKHTEGCGWVFWAWEGFYNFAALALILILKGTKWFLVPRSIW